MIYEEFLQSKVKMAPVKGFGISLAELNPRLKGHQAAIAQWLIEGGCRACFAAFGLGKSVIQLETARVIVGWLNAGKGDKGKGEHPTPNTQHPTSNAGARALIVAPLGVRQEFARDAAEVLGWEKGPRFIRTATEALESGVYLTNYESVRDGKIDVSLFDVVLLDEASVLRSFGSKTFGELIFGEAMQSVPYRFVATATPSPNDYQELLAYAAFLGVMDIGHARTRFFKRDSTKADCLTLHPHKVREFWLWVSSWALFVQRPSDIGFSDVGYDLPPLRVQWHEVATDHRDAGVEKGGQGKLLRDVAIGVTDAASEKRRSLAPRVAKMMELRAEDPLAHRILWHDLEAERAAIEDVVPRVVSVYGTQDMETREAAIIDFSNGKFAELAAKPVLAGSGCNFQRHCAWAIFLGIGFKFNDFIQAIHRLYRFMQTKEVRIDLIYSEAERSVRAELERKWRQHDEMVAQMTGIIREFGLAQAAKAHTLTRAMGVAERVEISGESYRIVHNDNVAETRRMETESVGLVLTSIPFANQYEYSPNYADFGHSEGNDEFFTQMDYLTPELARVLQPGRVAAIHVKDRVVTSGITQLGFQRVYPFHCKCIEHYEKHGLVFTGMKTIVTDVVRENNQTYRLGWTEQCKDATKMGCGMSEYLLLFRKPQTETAKSYADVPVRKSKEKYSRSRWQIDAHGFMRSSGERLLAPEEWREMPYKQIYRLFREYSLSRVYDFEYHVKIGEALDGKGKLPVDFMLLPPQSWSEEVWTDITRMRTLNGSQSQKGKQMHLCPMQFDLADRVIAQLSMPGEVVYDPFAGLMTVPYRAIKLGRFGVGCELNGAYFSDGAGYCKAAEDEMAMPSLFALETEDVEEEVGV